MIYNRLKKSEKDGLLRSCHVEHAEIKRERERGTGQDQKECERKRERERKIRQKETKRDSKNNYGQSQPCCENGDASFVLLSESFTEILKNLGLQIIRIYSTDERGYICTYRLYDSIPHFFPMMIVS